MNAVEKVMLDSASLDEPWALVASFAIYRHEHPDDVNCGMDEVVSRLRRQGVEVTVHQPSLCLSLPGAARVEAGGRSFRAKPPACSVDARNGLAGRLVHIGANQADDIDTNFDRKLDPTRDVRSRIEGNIVISVGFASPGMIAQFKELGAIGVIGINPGIDIHRGICTTVWGVPDLDDLPRQPAVVAVAVNRPDGDALIEIANAGVGVTIFPEMEEGWFDSKLPEVFIPGSEEPEKYVLLHGHLDSWDVGVGDNATGDATLMECARILWAHRDNPLRDIRLYAPCVARTANTGILPFDWRAAADEFLTTIARYQETAGDRFDLTPLRQAAETLKAALEDFHAGIAAGTVAPAAANAAIPDLARILVPINFTREPSFRHDPALSIPPLPTISVATELHLHPGEKPGFARNHLMRGQNRLISALNQARRRVAQAMG